MKSEDTEVRINAMRQLRKIAAALGADRTRKELIPFLNGVSTVHRAAGGSQSTLCRRTAGWASSSKGSRRTEDALHTSKGCAVALADVAEQVEDDDEVLLVMAEELGGFIDLVGGPAQAVILMGPLGALATVEETVVREKVRRSGSRQRQLWRRRGACGPARVNLAM